MPLITGNFLPHCHSLIHNHNNPHHNQNHINYCNITSFQWFWSLSYHDILISYFGIGSGVASSAAYKLKN